MVEPLLFDRKCDQKKVSKVSKASCDRGVESNRVCRSLARRRPRAEKLYELVRWFLESRNKVPHADACLEYYSRYGKSAEEIAKLGAL